MGELKRNTKLNLPQVVVEVGDIVHVGSESVESI